LFEQLRRLGQREERTFVGTARYQVVAGTFRGGAGQDGGFHIHEAAAVQEVTDVAGYPRTETQAVDHLGTAQVDKAVAQANVFTNVYMLIQRERRRGGGVQDGDSLPSSSTWPVGMLLFSVPAGRR